MTATAHTNTLPQHQHQHFSHFKTAFMGVELHAVCLILVWLTEHLKNKENEEQNYFSWYRDCMEDFLQLVCNGRFKISCIINVFQLQEGQFLHLLWPAHSRFSPYLNKLNLCDAGASPEGRNQMASCSLSLKKWTFGSLSWHNWLKLRSKSVIKSFFVWQQTEFYF